MQNSKTFSNHLKTCSVIQSSQNKEKHEAISILEQVFMTFQPFQEKGHREELKQVVAQAKAPLQRLKLPLKTFHSSFFREEQVDKKSVHSIKKGNSTHSFEHFKKPSSLSSNCNRFSKVPESCIDTQTETLKRIKEKRRKQVIEIKKSKDLKPKPLKIEKSNLFLFQKVKQIAHKKKTQNNIFYGFDGNKGQVSFQDTHQINKPSITLQNSLGKIKDIQLKPIKAKKEKCSRMSLEDRDFDNTYLLPNNEGNKYHIVDDQLQKQFLQTRSILLKIKQND